MPVRPRLRSDPLDAPHRSRLDPAHPLHEAIVTAHRRAVATATDGYLDPATGYRVFTARFLIDRGSCCETGCRHCPYVGGPDVPAA